ncbi:MAG: hypothetical protein OQJ89_12540, partial [Kangiellaceae bacterium]|nr:hypothetical protein [Kangiellaceae bacterium]
MSGFNSLRTIIRSIILLSFWAAISAQASNSNRQVILETIQHYSHECQSEEWQIWHHSLCGPLLLVDPQTRKVFASVADKKGILK